MLVFGSLGLLCYIVFGLVDLLKWFLGVVQHLAGELTADRKAEAKERETT